MQLFYCPDIQGNTHTLNEDESKHIIRVLRLKNGDLINLTDGKGGLYKAELIDDHPKRCTVSIVDTQNNYGKRSFKLHLAVAPTKNIGRYEWFLEKATEIGIDEITPIVCEHSERKEIKLVRFEKVIVSAIKQSLKAFIPKLNKVDKFQDFIKQDFSGQKFIAYCDEDHNLLKKQYTPRSDVIILIGPEGDFSPEEIKLAIKQGFVPVSLGESRLRTETAAIAACHSINMIND
ncbi:MAG: 16S rRNA (uracil(1498)-N(3))-methyltransferase [Bacteroidetes bacterium]|nr:16S rRNA (uracil(1498)-N(3))-methyltransferase [Bacteroidota bacterium]